MFFSNLSFHYFVAKSGHFNKDSMLIFQYRSSNCLREGKEPSCSPLTDRRRVGDPSVFTVFLLPADFSEYCLLLSPEAADRVERKWPYYGPGEVAKLCTWWGSDPAQTWSLDSPCPVRVHPGEDGLIHTALSSSPLSLMPHKCMAFGPAWGLASVHNLRLTDKTSRLCLCSD